jgi:pimeloyl-ACP methyl ester carboxylesterase
MDGMDGVDGMPVTVTANGLVFTGLQWGPADGAVVLCLHGFPQRCTSWTGVAERLAAAGLHTIAPDQRGYSPAARPLEVEAYALPHLVADVVGMIEAIGAPLHLVGHDWGGVVGWQVAARYPHLLRSWTAVSTPNQLALNQVLESSAEERERFGYIRKLRDKHAEEYLAAGGWSGFTGIFDTGLQYQNDDLAFFQQPGVLTAALNWYRAMHPRYSADLAPVAVPTTYIWGSEDLAFSRAAAELTGRFVIAPYRFVALEGAGHWLPDEAPDSLADAIAAQVGSG